MATDLSNQMRQIAPRYPEVEVELVEKADAFDVAAEGYYAREQTVGPKEFLGAWARARKLYSDTTGKPLI